MVKKMQIVYSGMAHIRGFHLIRRTRESTLSGSETRPGWPPDDMCADLTRYKGSFDEREREGLQLLSPVVRKKVLKLQRDLEEAKAESRYLRARPVDNTNRSRFTITPVPRYDGISDWDQYREVFEAIVASNGWDDLTAALQLIAHLDGEALNVALLVPDNQRKRPGVLVEMLTAHYTTPGRTQNTDANLSKCNDRRGKTRQHLP